MFGVSADFTPAQQAEWSREYEKHQQAVKSAKKHITTASKSDKEKDTVGLQQAKARARKHKKLERESEICRQNKIIVEKLYSISKKSHKIQQQLYAGQLQPTVAQGHTDSRDTQGRQADPNGTGLLHANYRRKVADSINIQNEQLVRRIMGVKTSLKVQELEAEFQRHQHLSSMLQKWNKPPPTRNSFSRHLCMLRNQKSRTADATVAICDAPYDIEEGEDVQSTKLTERPVSESDVMRGTGHGISEDCFTGSKDMPMPQEGPSGGGNERPRTQHLASRRRLRSRGNVNGNSGGGRVGTAETSGSRRDVWTRRDEVTACRRWIAGPSHGGSRVSSAAHPGGVQGKRAAQSGHTAAGQKEGTKPSELPPERHTPHPGAGPLDLPPPPSHDEEGGDGGWFDEEDADSGNEEGGVGGKRDDDCSGKREGGGAKEPVTDLSSHAADCSMKAQGAVIRDTVGVSQSRGICLKRWETEETGSGAAGERENEPYYSDAFDDEEEEEEDEEEDEQETKSTNPFFSDHGEEEQRKASPPSDNINLHATASSSPLPAAVCPQSEEGDGVPASLSESKSTNSPVPLPSPSLSEGVSPLPKGLSGNDADLEDDYCDEEFEDEDEEEKPLEDLPNEEEEEEEEEAEGGRGTETAAALSGDKRNCEGCRGSWRLQHALNCKRGGHVGSRHNEVNQAWYDLTELAFALAVGRGEPVVRVEGEVPGRPAFYGDFSVRELWARQRQAILDIRVVNTQAASYVQGDWQKVLTRSATGEKEQYAKPCRDKGYDFTPLVSSVDGALEKDAEMFPKKVAHLVSLKWDRTYRQVCTYMKARMQAAHHRATSGCLRGTRKEVRRVSVEGRAAAAVAIR
uniref:Uncharacterized protein n=1 Tax=Chromera velia CCMP2878 TaxID=1169474 RepID=A0A0G4I474_9ALVE|eukprot:Cvel_10856.t1-p1 / transcript=Cvel_10856.t1 / gene=Cvel_10856 / organism=Chromera_velia_CCMP2878 / gene_product=hypothetical protein / transcript_product=hypothetical protein / location=Cvel_scaffold664:64705-71819(+) / protein_length=854 / sequence_SO=supercontig / SO=protein_coding / is_pseudo=false